MGAIGIELEKRRPDRPQSSGSGAARGGAQRCHRRVRRRPTTRRGATTLRVMMWSRGVVFEVVCATEPCSGLVVFHKDCLRTVKLWTCVHQGGVVFEILGATEPCSGRVIFTRRACEQSDGGHVSHLGPSLGPFRI